MLQMSVCPQTTASVVIFTVSYMCPSTALRTGTSCLKSSCTQEQCTTASVLQHLCYNSWSVVVRRVCVPFGWDNHFDYGFGQSLFVKSNQIVIILKSEHVYR